ncbi:HEAT repeat domain-containing protein [Flavisolibacter tropicus]|uniref:HEAT repeat domain-containing protein n=1 Tax=Flavisolibacter tropicus TaxID=1492898 RepID=A0A172TTQ0_9BACT|nr:HEAT repeat domain-containing protein [Flavisolibacter tropicus]ANE50338.1 hypothetical protein SY85_07335 [Flavisolibacter tropicus]
MEMQEDIRAITYLLVGTAIGFSLLAFILLAIIFWYLFFFKRVSRKNQQLAQQFYTLVSEISLCESEEERQEVVRQAYVQDIRNSSLQKKRMRAFMVKAMLQFHRNIQGTAADNIKWLYEYLDLKRDTMLQLASRNWHTKAAAIQVLAEMGQGNYITKIYRYTNHKNYYIRSEAQVAVVKLTGFSGLRFMNVIDQPITQWQQLCLLQQLASHSNIQENKLQAWLTSENETVVELTLKLVKAYCIYSIHDAVVNCLTHSNPTIRAEAILVLKEIPQATTVPLLKSNYHKSDKVEKMAILQVLNAIGTEEDVPFLESLLVTKDMLLRNEVLKALQALVPGWQSHDVTFHHKQKNSVVA